MINIANALPQVFAPVLAGLLLWLVEAAGGVVESNGHGFSTGYLALYLLAFLSSVLRLAVRDPDPRRRLTRGGMHDCSIRVPGG